MEIFDGTLWHDWVTVVVSVTGNGYESVNDELAMTWLHCSSFTRKHSEFQLTLTVEQWYGTATSLTLAAFVVDNQTAYITHISHCETKRNIGDLAFLPVFHRAVAGHVRTEEILPSFLEEAKTVQKRMLFVALSS